MSMPYLNSTAPRYQSRALHEHTVTYIADYGSSNLLIRGRKSMLTSPFPNEDCTAHVHIQGSNIPQLLDFHSHITETQEFFWTSFSLISQDQDSFSWQICILQVHRSAALFKAYHTVAVFFLLSNPLHKIAWLNFFNVKPHISRHAHGFERRIKCKRCVTQYKGVQTKHLCCAGQSSQVGSLVKQ